MQRGVADQLILACPLPPLSAIFPTSRRCIWLTWRRCSFRAAGSSTILRMKSFGSIAVSVVALMFVGSVRSDDTPTTQEIVNAWKSREQKIKSFDVTWWSKRIVSAASLPYPSNLTESERQALPDHASIWRFHLVMDAEDHFFYEEYGRDYIPEKSEFAPRHVVETCDGKTFKTFFDTGLISHRVTSIADPDIVKGVTGSWGGSGIPIQIVFRPFDEHVGDKHVGVFFDPTIFLQKAETIEREHTLTINIANRTIWVDPEKGFAPIRYSLNGGDPDITISYEPNETVGWMPKSWTLKGWKYSETATVSQCTINGPISDSQFEMDLHGQGAILQINGKGKFDLAIIYPDGKQRPLTPSDHGKSFDQLVKTEDSSE